MVNFISMINGVREVSNAIPTSLGIEDSNKIIATNSEGKIDNSFLPSSTASIHKGTTAPTNTDLLWLETGTGLLLFYQSGSWYSCSFLSLSFTVGGLIITPTGYRAVILSGYLAYNQTPDDNIINFRPYDDYATVLDTVILSSGSNPYVENISQEIISPNNTSKIFIDTPNYKSGGITYRLKKI